jgi:transcriptional regulator with XRE-family HTH domain
MANHSNIVSRHFKTIREDLGLSQRAMASRLKTTQGAVASIENGVNSFPSYQMLEALIDKLHVNPYFIFPPYKEPMFMIQQTLLDSLKVSELESKKHTEMISTLERMITELKGKRSGRSTTKSTISGKSK